MCDASLNDGLVSLYTWRTAEGHAWNNVEQGVVRNLPRVKGG